MTTTEEGIDDIDAQIVALERKVVLKRLRLGSTLKRWKMRTTHGASMRELLRTVVSRMQATWTETAQRRAWRSWSGFAVHLRESHQLLTQACDHWIQSSSGTKLRCWRENALLLGRSAPPLRALPQCGGSGTSALQSTYGETCRACREI